MKLTVYNLEFMNIILHICINFQFCPPKFLVASLVNLTLNVGISVIYRNGVQNLVYNNINIII